MSSNEPLQKEVLSLAIEGVPISLCVMRREGHLSPLLFLHGFGSSKEDVADLAGHPLFADRPILAFDAPGCGETRCADLSRLSLDFLRRTAEAVLQHYGIRHYHLAGHSMGGLTALLLADGQGDAVLSFTNIKGNLAPQDCFLSRQILDYPAESADAFMTAFQERLWAAPDTSNALYAAALPHKVRAEAIAPIFRSMVARSDEGDLLDLFTGLSCPKMFVYGESFRSLSYLPHLLRRGVQLAEVEAAGHFPMYANPQALWSRMGRFIALAEREPKHG